MPRRLAAWLAAGLLCASCSSAPATNTPPRPTHSPEGSSSPSASARLASGAALPNQKFTPGEAFAGVTAAEVCTPGWASSHRNVASAQYREVYAEYAIPYPEPSGAYELDHLIPLELGGDNANANLWPEPAVPTPGFHQKDLLEDALHTLVCEGTVSLAEAQHDFASDWYTAYVKYVVG
jgi:hypothetical protein